MFLRLRCFWHKYQLLNIQKSFLRWYFFCIQEFRTFFFEKFRNNLERVRKTRNYLHVSWFENSSAEIQKSHFLNFIMIMTTVLFSNISQISLWVHWSISKWDSKKSKKIKEWMKKILNLRAPILWHLGFWLNHQVQFALGYQLLFFWNKTRIF